MTAGSDPHPRWGVAFALARALPPPLACRSLLIGGAHLQI